MMPDDVSRGTSQTSVSDTDYTGWLTKAEAATRIGVTTKTVERFAAEGQLQHATTQRQGRGPRLAVYHPDDVARVAAVRHQTPAPFVLPAGTASPVNGNGHHGGEALARPSKGPPAGEDLLRGFMGAILHAVSQTSQTSTLFLTVDEAAAVSGLSRNYVRQVIKSGVLPAVRNRGWKIRRKDLEAL